MTFSSFQEEKKTKLPVSRTRSGRISRPPQHKLVDFKHLLPASYNNSKDTGTYLDYKLQDENDLKDTGQGWFYFLLFLFYSVMAFYN